MESRYASTLSAIVIENGRMIEGLGVLLGVFDKTPSFFCFRNNKLHSRCGDVWAPFIFQPKSSVSPNLSVVFQSLDDADCVHSADGFTVFGYVNARVRARQLFNQIGNWGFGIDRF